jgi:hypothetical protein
MPEGSTPKVVVACRGPVGMPADELAGQLAGRAASVGPTDAAGWVVEPAWPDQELLRAAGMRYDGRPLFDVLLWARFEEPGAPLVALDAVAGALGALCASCTALALDEFEAWDRTGPGRPGAGAVKLVSFTVRRPGLEPSQFARHYREHVDVARVHHPGVCRYVQNLVTGASGDGADGVEAVSELWFAGEGDFRGRFYADDGSPAAVRADNEEYIDFSRTRSLLVKPAPSDLP